MGVSARIPVVMACRRITKGLAILCGLFFSFPINAQVLRSASGDSAWAVRIQTAEVANPPVRLECHPLPYFLEHWEEFNYGAGELGPYPTDVKDSARSRRVGAIDGYAIYDVIHTITTGGESIDPRSAYLPTVIKMILVERMPGEFCEIFNEENFAGHDLIDVGPSYMVDVDSQKFLATHDQVNGTCGCYNEAYWSFDKNGPILLDSRIIWDAVKKLVQLLPTGSHEPSNSWPGFDIQNLSFGPFRWWKDDGAGGNIYIKFALTNHQLTVASQTIDDNSDHPFPTYGAPPTRINVDADTQARKLIKRVQPVLPESASSITGTVLFHAIIAKDGSVSRLDVIVKGDPYEMFQIKQLIDPAFYAVREWRYAPTLLDGSPVEVETTISVTFPPAR
jgi:hypothetical protein